MRQVSGDGGASPRRQVATAGLTVAALAAAGLAGLLTGGDRAEGAAETEVIGRSVNGNPIQATQFGDPAAEHVVLVVGVIHGDERAGLRVIEEIRQDAAGIAGSQLWLISTVNPDGLNRGSRKNSHAVDLNRNFPYRWRGGVPKSSGYYPGTKPASEPETKVVMRFTKRIRPDVSVWYHQDWNAVLACRGRPRTGARYAKLAGMRLSCRGNDLRGTAVSWQQRTIPGAEAFVVELPGRVSAGQVARHADASIALATGGG
jgi:murein peptide amidase A